MGEWKEASKPDLNQHPTETENKHPEQYSEGPKSLFMGRKTLEGQREPLGTVAILQHIFEHPKRHRAIAPSGSLE